MTAINVGESTGPFLLAILLPLVFAALLGAMMFYGRISDVYMGVITLVVTLILFKFINSTANETWIVGKARLGGFNGIPAFPTLNVPGDPARCSIRSSSSMSPWCFCCWSISACTG